MHINGFPHSKRLNNQQQKVERVSVQAYGEQTQTQPETNPSLGALASFPDFRVSDGSCLQSACFSHVTFSTALLLLTPPPPSMSLLCFSSPFSPVFFFYLFGCQTYGSMTWWSWCWRSAYPRSPTVSATCCCARLGFYWACSTATSLCERSVRLMSTGESFCTFFDYSYFRIMKLNNRSVLFF